MKTSFPISNQFWLAKSITNWNKTIDEIHFTSEDFIKHLEASYSQTCIRQPLLGALKSGCLGLVVIF